MGGTFDPIHYGHLVVAEEVRTSLQLPEVVFIPAGQPPHKAQEDITTASHRAAMVALAIASNPYFTLSSVEIERSGPSYSVDTLRLLRQQWGAQVELSYIIGWDSLEELHHWHEPVALLEQITHLVAVRRPGHEEEPGYKDLLEGRLPGITKKLLVVPAPQLEISATDLRQRVAEGRPIKYQTPESVEQYIMEHSLYKDI